MGVEKGAAFRRFTVSPLVRLTGSHCPNLGVWQRWGLPSTAPPFTPGKIVRVALAISAVAAILAHNYPSGNPEPSTADRTITNEPIATLRLVGVRVLDHLVIGAGQVVSMAARGLL